MTALAQVFEKVPDLPFREALAMISKADPHVWTMRHRRLRGHPLTYDINREIATYEGDVPMHALLRHRPFLIQPLRDQHPHKVYKKGRQVGVSELSITEVFAFLDCNPNTKVIYTFPRDTQLKDFSVTRIGEALDETKAMQRLKGIPCQVYTKRIGDSYMILRSAWESNLGEGIDADMVVLDEKDRMKEGVDIAFRESLQSSKFGMLREVSTPTLPGRGVDAPYQNSCQYEWFVRCTKCGTAQPIVYPDNVVQVKDVEVGTKQLEPGTYEYRCHKEKCRGELNRMQGEWVARHPSRTHIAGYHMPQTVAPWQDATKLMQKKIDYKYLQLWQNYCLAECSLGEKILLNDDHFDNCIAGHNWHSCRSNQWSRVVAGIDWGQFNWCLIWGVNAFNNLPYLIGYTVVEDDDRDPLGSARGIGDFLGMFEPDCIVADAGYGKDRNAYLLRQYEGKFFACYYNPSEKHSRTFKPQFVPNSGRLLADRTIALKDACRIIRDREIGLPGRDQFVELIIKHYKALAPIQVQDDDGSTYEVIDKTGDDHLAHCMAYCNMAFDYVTEGWNAFQMISDE